MGGGHMREYMGDALVYSNNFLCQLVTIYQINADCGDEFIR